MTKQFNIGDRVIALSSGVAPNQPRSKGNKYTVTRLLYCRTNGQQFINIDDTPATGSSGFLLCTCGKKHKSGNIAYTLSDRFVKDDPNVIKQELEDALESEDYDTAILLRDIVPELIE